MPAPNRLTRPVRAGHAVHWDMADQLYLSVWFPNFRLENLPAKLIAVMQQFALIAGPDSKRVHAAAAYPISFSEPATYQRLYVTDPRAEDNADTAAATIETAVAEATEQLHDDMAYEFEMRWRLWTPDSGPGSPEGGAGVSLDPAARLDPLWRPVPTTVRILGFGPTFDDASSEQNGQIRVDFGLDYPWVLEGDSEDPSDSLDDEEEGEPETAASNLLAFRSPGLTSQAEGTAREAALYIKRNVEMLLAFTLSVEKHCGISSRLLWTELGEPLAEKLIARLQRLH